MQIDNILIDNQMYEIQSYENIDPLMGKTWKYSVTIDNQKYDLSSKVDDDIVLITGKYLKELLIIEMRIDISNIINGASK